MTTNTISKVIGAANEKHESALEQLCNFISADSIEYRDLSNGEDYIINKNGNSLILSIRCNKVDGAFLYVNKRG